MTAEMMVVTDLAGRKLTGERDASSELKMHLEVYHQRPDVGAVVHAHPPTATGFAVAGVPLTRAVLAEVITTLGGIPIAEYATPSTAELPAAIRAYIKSHDGLLLANHGALAVGRPTCSPPITGWRRSSISPRSAWWRACSAASTSSRAKRWSGCRGCAGCTASPRRRRSAPMTRAEPPTARSWMRRRRRTSGSCPTRRCCRPAAERTGTSGEIRLTYGELTALIDEAVRGVEGK